jgi:hypothetical protein
MKRIIMILAVLALGVSILAATAGAAITITPAPAGPGYQNLSPWNCDGRTFSQSGSPIRLGFGWFANNEGGLKQFFRNTHGSVSITGTDTFNDSWNNSSNGNPFVTQQGIVWTSGEAGIGTPPGGGTVTGVASFYRGVLAFVPGTYTLSVSFVFDKAVNDGWDTYTDPISNGGCTFTVVP